jgi:hypothetical protein
MKSTHHHLPDQLSQGTVEQKMVNTSMLAAEVAMGITIQPLLRSPWSGCYFSASTKGCLLS